VSAERTVHRLLERQLRRAGVTGAGPPDEARWLALVDAVSRTYSQHDQDRYLLERSLEMVSTEMRGLNDELRAASATALTRERDRLREALKAADAASEAKSHFLALMSHEIRTPMNGMLGMLDLLRRTDLTGEQHHFADSAARSGEALLRIINDILDFSKVEAGHVTLESVDFDIRRLVDEVLGLMLPEADRKSLSLTWTVDDSVPAWLRADPGRLRQVLLNLVANSIKFTERGGVSVHVVGEYPTQDPVSLRVTVIDSGIGMTEEQCSKLFQPFVQADSSTTRLYGGTGLGLSISRRLVELMGGRIGVESVPAAGSKFWLTVPLAVGEETVSEKRHPLPVINGEVVRRVLVADDNDVNREVALAMLEALGCEADTARNGREAVDAVARNRYDLVLMDCQMPEMDGYEATREIRRRESGMPPMPVVAMTANAVFGDREKCLAAGMTDYLSKPYTLDGLRRVLAAVSTLDISAGI